MKKCPYCAEEIQDEAIVCRYCGRDLNPKPQVPVVAVAPEEQPEKKSSRSGLFVLFVVVLVIILCVVTQCNNSAKTTTTTTTKISAADEYRASFVEITKDISSTIKEMSIQFSDAGEDSSLFLSSTWKADLYKNMDRVTGLLNQVKALKSPGGFAQTKDYLQRSINEYALFSAKCKEGIDNMDINKFNSSQSYYQKFNDYLIKAIEGLANQ